MIGQIISKQLKEFNVNIFVRGLKIFSFLAIFIILYAFIFSGLQIVDEFEHLHASWLVSIGEMPYTDFFEHHHPLLWYISAPLVSLFYDKAVIFYIMRGGALLVSFATLWYMYKIASFWGRKECGWLAIALALGNIITLYNIYQFRPDTFMNFCFIFGIYYFFNYLHQRLLKYLIYSFLGFTVSFLFLQKISLLLMVVEFILLWLVYQKKITFKNITLAALPSIGILGLFLGYFYYKGAFLEYFDLNFRFNQALVSYFERGSFWYQRIWFSFYFLAFMTAIFFYKKENDYFKITALLYMCEFLMRTFYFAPHPNYYTLLTYLSALILSIYGKILMPRHKILSIAVIIFMYLYLGSLFNRLDDNINKHNSYQHYLLADYVHRNSTKEDFVMNGYDKNFNIYRKDVSYYWFGLDMLLPVMKQEYDIQNVDINQMILQYRPKFIYTQNYVDLWAMRVYGEQRYTQTFIPELINSLYTKTPFEYLAALK